MSLKLFLVSILLLLGCSNRKEYINLYEQNLPKSGIDCLGVDEMSQADLSKYLDGLYHFDKSCRYKISLSSRAKIVCNSSFNAPQKATTNFPSAYLRLELKDGMALIFSYYADLTSPPDESDVKRAFEVLRERIKPKEH